MLHEPILNPSRAKYRREPSKLFVPPLLPTLVPTPPEGADWEHEIKYDGYRTLIVLDHGKCWAFTRNGHTGPTATRPWLLPRSACAASPLRSMAR
jgi:ATP-dependent DNA ligase